MVFYFFLKLYIADLRCCQRQQKKPAQPHFEIAPAKVRRLFRWLVVGKLGN